MAISDTARFAAFSRLGDDWELLTHTVEGPETGWDVWSGTFIRDFGTLAVGAADVLASWAIGRRPVAGRDFWTVQRTPTRVGGNIWKLNVVAHGTVGNRPVKVRLRSAVNVSTVQNAWIGWPWVMSPRQFIGASAVKESDPCIEASYILIGEDAPLHKMGIAGLSDDSTLAFPKRLLPPVTVRVPSPFWSWLTNPTYNWPSGWSRDSVEADTLSGTDTQVHMITEVWNYKQPTSP